MARYKRESILGTVNQLLYGMNNWMPTTGKKVEKIFSNWKMIAKLYNNKKKLLNRRTWLNAMAWRGWRNLAKKNSRNELTTEIFELSNLK